MTITPERTAQAVTDPREAVSPEVFDRLARRVMVTEGTTRQHAERVMVQTLGFLQACALSPHARLVPSRQVDAGWHAFVLHTRDYADFCERVAGRFIDHVPDDTHTHLAAGQQASVRTTVEAMRAAGLPVDDELWSRPAECSQCHAGCHDSPRGA